jgi:MFS family permease
MAAGTASPGLGAALAHSNFRRIWMASLPSNLGMLINGVGAGWAMIELGGTADQVALVQTSIMLPFMLFALPAGAISDTYDRRTVGIVAVCFAIATSMATFLMALFGLLTPVTLLVMGLAIGAANALFTPAWVSSVGEQLPRELLPQGVALNSISFNTARAFGPAIGGALVAAWGSVAAFGANALAFLPMLAAQILWRREREKPRLPPEQAWTATVAGARYVFHTPPIRIVIVRAVLFGAGAGSIAALMPLIARDLLGGGPGTYGTLLGCYGAGAVCAAMLIGRARRRFTVEQLISGSIALMGLAFIALAAVTVRPLVYAILFVAGVCWLMISNGFGVSIQTYVPRWVVGRAVASFQAAISGGMAIGSVLWGQTASAYGTALALALSGVMLLANALIGRFYPISPTVDQPHDLSVVLAEPDVDLGITGRSGPIMITFEYEVPRDDARSFYAAISNVRRIRSRNGGYGWSIARDIADGRLWTERFHCATWNDYLRMRSRMTEAERRFIDERIGRPMRIRRHLERPSGSVRFAAESPDRGIELTLAP